jgi:hypothetical protein
MEKGKRKSYLLRINEDLWNELNSWANQEFRSVNGQIELILQRAIDERRSRNPHPKPAEAQPASSPSEERIDE